MKSNPRQFTGTCSDKNLSLSGIITTFLVSIVQRPDWFRVCSVGQWVSKSSEGAVQTYYHWCHFRGTVSVSACSDIKWCWVTVMLYSSFSKSSCAAVEDMNSLPGCAGATVLFNKTQQEISLEKWIEQTNPVEMDMKDESQLAKRRRSWSRFDREAFNTMKDEMILQT